jgi:hypothetical protein
MSANDLPGKVGPIVHRYAGEGVVQTEATAFEMKANQRPVANFCAGGRRREEGQVELIQREQVGPDLSKAKPANGFPRQTIASLPHCEAGRDLEAPATASLVEEKLGSKVDDLIVEVVFRAQTHQI